MPVKKSRSRATIYNDTGQRIDQKSKQLLFFQCDVETIKRIWLKSYDDFTKEGAKLMFDKYQRNRQSRSTLYCLIDRMRFEKRGKMGSSPFRKHLTYREIRHFFVFPENPKIFMLCVCDDHGKKSYELYRCKPEDVNTICDLTYGASTDPQNIIRDVETALQLSVSSKEYMDSPLITENPNSNEHVYGNGPAAKQLSESYKYNTTPAAPILSDIGSGVDSIRSAEIFQNGTTKFNYQNDYNVTKKNHVPSSLHVNSKKTDVKGVYGFYELPEADSLTRPQDEGRIPMIQTQRTFQQLNMVPANSTRMAKSELELINSSSPDSQLEYQRTVKIKSTTNTERLVRENGYNRPQSNLQGNITIVRECTKPLNTNIKKFHSTLDLCSDNEITFIGRDRCHGPHVTENGPVYMYITRYESQQDVRMGRTIVSSRRYPKMPPFNESSESFV